VLVPNCLVGYSIEDHANTASAPTSPNRARAVDGIRALSPAVVIVDDIDKVRIDLGALESFRDAARLLILTANNAQHDRVLDAAEGRPGRVDEIFPIAGRRAERPEPFDRLDSETWERVCCWPVAMLEELAKRIRHRGTTPAALNLDELADRLKRGTRSMDTVYR
jgi:hypothetical protein